MNITKEDGKKELTNLRCGLLRKTWQKEKRQRFMRKFF